jgi:penicillin-binding protein 1A
LLELTGAYGVIAHGGRALEPYLIRRVRTAAGKVLFERRAEPSTALIAPNIAGALSDMLLGVVSRGTGRRAALAEHAVAGKTGTTQDFKDAWFVGYTAHLVAGVWVGNDDARPMRKVTGGSLPARLWHDVMSIAHEGLPPRALPGSPPSERAGLGPSRALDGAGATRPALQRGVPEFFAGARAGAEPAPAVTAQSVVR